MKTVDVLYEGAIEVKGSKFLSYLVPIASYELHLEEIKAKHPKARHVVTAGRFFNDEGQIEEFFSDDREPKGSAGFPTLKVLQGNEMIESAIITVRYFGGTLLGVGGLVRAYSDSANDAIKNAPYIEYKKQQRKTFTIKYADISKAEYLFGKFSLTVLQKDFGNDGGSFTCAGEEKNIECFEREFFER